MRKILISLLIALALLFVIRRLTPSSSVNPPPELVKQIVDFQESQTTQSVAERAPSKVKHLIPVASSVIRNLGTCLKKDHCGEQPTPGRAYFDPHNTESNRKLNRALRFALAMQGKGNLEDFPKKEDLLPLISIENDETPVLALEIILEENVASCEDILSEVNQEQGRSLPLVFSILLKSKCDRARVLNELNHVMSTCDPDSLQAIAKELVDFNLSQQEFLNLSPNFCRLKNSPTNWPDLKHQMTLFIESQGFNLSVSRLCGIT